MKVFNFFHSLIEVDVPPFVDVFHPKTKVILEWETFVSAWDCSSHLSSGGPLGMVYELLRDYFVLDDYASVFDLFFKVCGHIVRGHVPPSISCLLSKF
jgi:hypothetical protein